MAQSIKIITCNLESGLGVTRGYYQHITSLWKHFLPSNNEAIEQCISYIQRESPDILFVNEIDAGSSHSNYKNQIDKISGAIRAEGTFFPTTHFFNFWNQGNAIFTSQPIKNHTTHVLPGTGEKRILAEMIIDLGGREVGIYTTHLGLNSRERKLQIETIARIVSQKKHHIILAGDFNTLDVQEMQPLRDVGLTCITSPTFPSWKPAKQFDYICVSEHFDVIEYAAYSDILFSDHLPLRAQISLR
jgi:endonuclease/exonuclease/phosphatase family metal-dependent hydrolase